MLAKVPDRIGIFYSLLFNNYHHYTEFQAIVLPFYNCQVTRHMSSKRVESVVGCSGVFGGVVHVDYSLHSRVVPESRTVLSRSDLKNQRNAIHQPPKKVIFANSGNSAEYK